LELIRDRLPNRSEMLAVLGVAVFVCYSWTLLGFLNKFSSFILYFTLGEIADIFAFMMAFALLESVAVTGVLALLSILLPSGWLRDGFAFKGFVILVIATATSILFQKTLGDDFPSTFVLILFSLLPLALSVALITLVRSMPKVRRLITNIQDRILIMLFVYIPIGLLSLVVVLYRNLL
jgi:hypothetical protein